MKQFILDMREEIRLVLTEPWILLILAAAPILYPFVYNTAYINRFERNVPIAVCDLDNSAQSRELIRRLESHELTAVTTAVSDPAELDLAIRSGGVNGGILIDRNFSKNILRGKRAVLKLYIQNSSLMASSDISRAVGDVVSAENRRLAKGALQAAGVSRIRAEELTLPVDFQVRERGNAGTGYGDFIMPALMMLIIQQTLLAGTAVSVSRDRRRLHRLSDPQRIIGTAARLTPYLLLYLFHTAVLCLIQFPLWKLPFSPEFWSFTIPAGLWLFSTALGGYILGSLFRDPVSALIAAMFSTYPIFLICGYAWPSELLPPIFRAVSQLIPTEPFLRGFVSVGFLEGSLENIRGCTIHLGILSLLYMGIAAVSGRRQFRRQTKKG